MNEVQAISMNEPRQRLAKLEEIIPDAFDKILYVFGRYLVDHLNPRLAPMGFVMGCEIAILNLQVGVNEITGKPIPSCLVGYPPAIYNILHMEIPRIADAIFPLEFAENVRDHFETFNARLQEKRVAE